MKRWVARAGLILSGTLLVICAVVWVDSFRTARRVGRVGHAADASSADVSVTLFFIQLGADRVREAAQRARRPNAGAGRRGAELLHEEAGVVPRDVSGRLGAARGAAPRRRRRSLGVEPAGVLPNVVAVG